MKPGEKLDLFKQHKADYAAPKKPILLDIKKALYLAISGQGKPGGAMFEAKIGALYSIAFTIKMTRKFEGLGDYGICKLECLWEMEGEEDFLKIPQDQWRWKFMIRTPEFISEKDLNRAKKTLTEKGKTSCIEEVHLEFFNEGKCVQMLHVGPYDREGETTEIMKDFTEGQGLILCGKHHEIYLSDPRRIPPERLKTILRHPVKKRNSIFA